MDILTALHNSISGWVVASKTTLVILLRFVPVTMRRFPVCWCSWDRVIFSFWVLHAIRLRNSLMILAPSSKPNPCKKQSTFKLHREAYCRWSAKNIRLFNSYPRARSNPTKAPPLDAIIVLHFFIMWASTCLWIYSSAPRKAVRRAPLPDSTKW